MLSVRCWCVTMMIPLWHTTKDICEGFSWKTLSSVVLLVLLEALTNCKVTLGLVFHRTWAWFFTGLGWQASAERTLSSMLLILCSEPTSNLGMSSRQRQKHIKESGNTPLRLGLQLSLSDSCCYISELHSMVKCTSPLQEKLRILWTTGMNRERMNNWSHTGNEYAVLFFLVPTNNS